MENPLLGMTMHVKSVPATDPGRKRPNNEDWVAGFEPTDSLEAQQSGSLYIVADGVGGASKGERASQYAAKKVLYEYYQEPDIPPAQRLESIIRKACNDIYEYSINNMLSSMATTMVAAVVRNNKLIVANVGDSRGYLIRGAQVIQITRDHNLAEELLRNGSLTAEEAKISKTKNTLLRSLGGEADVEVDIFDEIQLYPGDLILLCTDGLTRYVENEDLLRLTANGNLEEISEKLIDFANQSGGADNITLYLIEIDSESQNLSRNAGNKPEPVTWDTIQTQKLTRKSRGRKGNLFGNRILVYAILGMSVLVLVTGSIVLSMRGKNKPTAIAGTQTNLVTIPTIITTSEDPVLPTTIIRPLTNEVDPLITITPTTTIIPTVTPTITSTMTETVVPTSIPTGQFSCVHEIQQGEGILAVFVLFSPRPPLFEPYYKFITCNFSNSDCTGPRQEIPNKDNISPRTFLIVPDVSQETCIKVANSYWVTVN